MIGKQDFPSPIPLSTLGPLRFLRVRYRKLNTVLAPESTLRAYISNTEEGLSFTNSIKFMKYLREHRPNEYAATMASRKES